MGKLIATTRATLDGVIDPVGEGVQADGGHGDYSFERQAKSSGLVLGRTLRPASAQAQRPALGPSPVPGLVDRPYDQSIAPSGQSRGPSTRQDSLSARALA